MSKRMRCMLEQVDLYGGDVFHVTLIPDAAVDFDAGQYLQVVMSEEDKRPFTIANAPEVKNRIALHIGATAENHYALEVLERLKRDGEIEIELPLGKAVFQNSDRPMLFLIGGTGFAYAHSIIEHCLLQGISKPISLYWGVRQAEYMYAAELAKKWAKVYPFITFIPVVEHPELFWHGKTGMVHNVLLEEHPNLAEYEIYVAGRFEMAKVARDAFIQAGADIAHLHGDAYSFV